MTKRAKRAKSGGKRAVIILIVFVLLAAAGYGIKLAWDYASKQLDLAMYPLEYTDYVEKYAEKYEVEPYLLYAIIKTESSFNSDAVSNVGARGLMQIMEETFDWIKYRLSEGDEISYDDMFDPEQNIRYGAYLISYLLDYFGNTECAIAAYHAGVGSVGSWLGDKEYSSDGETLDSIPIKDTAHYVNKIDDAYDKYIELYKNGGK